jgi:hypothetical protein
MLDLTKPVNISLVAILVVFLISMGILYLSKPSWIQKLNSKGKAEISYPLLVSYSITFALVCGVAALLLSSKKTGGSPENTMTKPPASSAPSATSVHAFMSR